MYNMKVVWGFKNVCEFFGNEYTDSPPQSRHKHFPNAHLWIDMCPSFVALVHCA